MKDYEVVGFYWQGDVLCMSCALEETTQDDEDELEPIFASHEFDFLPQCENCGEEIEVEVIGED